MNIEKMLQTQITLDDRIIKEHGLEGKDLFPNTILALIVELSEFANEGRWFKHWSNNQEPRTKVKCEYCSGKGYWELDYFQQIGHCHYCNGKGFIEGENPLLEEYVDSVHFFLSIANQKGWQDALYISSEPLMECYEEMYREGKKKYLTDTFLETIYFLTKAYMEINPNENKIAGFKINVYHFRLAWSLFITIGLVGFNFTPDQIEQAYFAKNAVNHERQNSGY
ncbi:dUTP diphosphatase [Niallia sp. Krafla_26]|uniref:dUTP diphosphatase n=1 Tax=Niallia sp. Krafla_26 TaxID=3064703 RepID=UPI003D17381A